jgi:hypothetical protein
VLYSLLLRDSLAFRVDVPGSVRAGEPVHIAVRLTNKTERVLPLASGAGGRTFDVTVSRADGTIIWRRVHGGTVSDGQAERVLEPAESLVFEASWDGRAAGRPAAPGRYLVTGTLLIEGEEPLVTRPTPFELLPFPPGSP